MDLETAKKIKKILVVEDEKPLNNALQLALKHAGFETTPAFDGEDALNKLSQNKFDIVLLDLLLPKMTGFDVMAKMSEKHDLTPVIVITNLGQEESRKEATGLGAIKYLVKSETSIADIVKQVQNFN